MITRHGGRRTARCTTRFALAAVAAVTLAACVPAAGIGPGPGPGFGQQAGNGSWTAPPGFQLSFPHTSTEGAFSAGVLSSGASDWYLVYDDGTRLGWGRMGEGGVPRGTWVRAGGPVSCPLLVPPPDALIARGFQFHQPLSVWSTFEAQVQAGPNGSEFEGSWGGCGIPLGVPWTGQAG